MLHQCEAWQPSQQQKLVKAGEHQLNMFSNAGLACVLNCMDQRNPDDLANTQTLVAAGKFQLVVLNILFNHLRQLEIW